MQPDSSAAKVFYWWISVNVVGGGLQTFLNNYSVSTMKCELVYGLNIVITVIIYKSYQDASLNVVRDKLSRIYAMGLVFCQLSFDAVDFDVDFEMVCSRRFSQRIRSTDPLFLFAQIPSCTCF